MNKQYGKYMAQESKENGDYICFARMPTQVDSKIEMNFGMSIVNNQFLAFLISIDDNFTIKNHDSINEILEQNNNFDDKEFKITQNINGNKDCNYRLLGETKYSEIWKLDSQDNLCKALDTIDKLMNVYYDTFALRLSQIYDEVLLKKAKNLEGRWFMNV